MREIFRRHTDRIEPLSLDEAYLDVTENKTGLPTATQVARTIREQIRTELQLPPQPESHPTSSLQRLRRTGRNQTDFFVIQPEEVNLFLLPLAVGRLPGVGKIAEEKLKSFDMHAIADLRRLELASLESRFGRHGVRLYELARGIDERQVAPDQPTTPFRPRIRLNAKCRIPRPSR